MTDSDFVRQPRRTSRRQREALNLPFAAHHHHRILPANQGSARRTRAAKGEITKTEYDEYAKAQIDACIKHREQIGLDVLVHGEFEA